MSSRKPAFLLLGVCAAALCGVEVVSRLLVRQDALIYQDSLDPELRFELRPGAEGMKEGSWVRINADGLRERDIPRAKPAGEYRVVIVGDTPAFGLGLAEEDVFARRLEGMLKPPRGRRLLTVNLSMYGYDVPQQLELLEKKGFAYHPDLVVFETEVAKQALRQARFDFPRLKNILRAHSVFMRRLIEKSYWSGPGSAGRPPIDPRSAEEALARLSALLKREGVPGLLVLFPDQGQDGAAEAARDEAQAAYRRFAADRHLPCYEVSAAFGPGPWTRWRRPDGRPNTEAENAAAAGMAPAIQRLIR
jgi:hypothetical protein